MQACGASDADIQALRARLGLHTTAPQEGQTFGVHADNLLVAQAFLEVSTQWQRAGMAGQRMGLCYAGVSAWLDLFVRRRDRRSVMQGLQVMERAVLAADQEQREKNQGE